MPFNPFSANNTVAFSSNTILSAWAARSRMVARVSVQARMAALSTLEWNAYGYTFPQEYNFSTAIFQETLSPMFLYSGERRQQTAQRAVVAADFDGWPLRVGRGVTKGGRSLRKYGYAMIDESWGLSKLLTGPTGLARAISATLDAASKGRHANQNLVGSVGSGRVAGVDLGPLLSVLQPRLEALARNYLGDDAQLTQLSAKRNASSQMWHHDRCGRRLKAFVFLTDVDARTFPTRIAVGSHDTLYHSYHSFDESRFRDAYVEANYRIADMVGPFGCGFIFDTNAIHRGNGFGTRTRDTLLFQLNARQKSKVLHRLGAPCLHHVVN